MSDPSTRGDRTGSDGPSSDRTGDHRGETLDSGVDQTNTSGRESTDPVQPDHEVDPAIAFSLLGNETRLEIVTTLHNEKLDAPHTFSELFSRSRVDDSGGFNYHLSELVPHFVSKGEDGYKLTAAGRRIGRALVAGMYTDSPAFEPVGIPGECYSCGTEALTAAYSDEHLRIRCTACDRLVLRVAVPPSVVRNRTGEAVVEAFDRWSRDEVRRAWDGLCPNCGGAVKWRLREDPPDHLSFDVLPAFHCEVCEMARNTSFGALAHELPEVRSFHRRHGVDLEERPYWEVECIMDTELSIVSTDPWRVRSTCTAGEEACHVVFDEDIEVVRTEIAERSE